MTKRHMSHYPFSGGYRNGVGGSKLRNNPIGSLKISVTGTTRPQPRQSGSRTPKRGLKCADFRTKNPKSASSRSTS
jgi:hypothetical protein